MSSGIAFAQARGRVPPGHRTKPLAPRPTFPQATIDVFFPDALKQLGPRAAEVATSKLNQPRPDAPTDEQSASGVLWSKLISAETVEDEIKLLAQQLAADVQSPAHFKAAGYQQARVDLTELAALFGIVAQYDGQVRWKEQALALRPAFARAGHNCKAASDGALREAQARAADLADLVRGGQVQAAASAEDPWQTIADREALMSRLEAAAEKRLPGVVADRRQYERNRATVAHEAEIIAALARLIQRSEYELADDQNYQKFAAELEKAALGLGGAARDVDAATAQQALTGVRQSCERCHADFRG